MNINAVLSISLALYFFVVPSSNAGQLCTLDANSAGNLAHEKNELSVKDLCYQAQQNYATSKEGLATILDAYKKNPNRKEYQEALVHKDKLEKSFQSYDDNVENLVRFVFSSDNDNYYKQMVEVINNAIKLNKAGFTSFYHARHSNGSFASDLANILDCQKFKCNQEKRKQAFFLFSPFVSDKYYSMEELVSELTSGHPEKFEDQGADWRAVGISSNIFLSGGRFKKDEYTLGYYNLIDLSPVGPKNQRSRSDIETVLKSYRCSPSPEELNKLLGIAEGHFGASPHFRLYQISIKRDFLNQVVNLTQDWGRYFPFVNDNNTTLEFLSKLQRGKYSFWEDQFLKWAKGDNTYMSTLNSLQARIFIRRAIFSNPENVTVTRYKNGAPGNDFASDQSYMEKIKDWVNRNCPQ